VKIDSNVTCGGQLYRIFCGVPQTVLASKEKGAKNSSAGICYSNFAITSNIS